ncbi:secreted protein [Melampsora americana]|nr:secreted protein [Melampsora americana]
MHLSQCGFIFTIILLLYISLVFGQSTQDCGYFWGPSVSKPGKWLCQNSGLMTYYCSPPKNKADRKVTLLNCTPYKKFPSLINGLEPSVSPSKQVCDSAKSNPKSFYNEYLDCGKVTVVNGKFQVTAALQCLEFKGPLKKATGCQPIANQLAYP